MWPKDFRKIYHPEPKILNSLVNAHMDMSKCRADPTKGGSAKSTFFARVCLPKWLIGLKKYDY